MNREINENVAGYQAAARDVLQNLEEGGVGQVMKWLTLHGPDQERTQAAIQTAVTHWSGKPVLNPAPIFSTGDVNVLTAALQHWLRLGDTRYTEEQYGMLLFRLAKAGSVAFEHEKSANPEENR